MNGERQRMCPWLESQVNSGRVPNVKWVDKPRGIFQVPWKHAGKPGFVLDQDAVLFREWARHTGKYRDGEQTDPSTWKTRFRCAINKLPDITEIKDKSNLDGEAPYRVFQFLPKGMTKTEKTELFPNSPFSDCGLSTSPASSSIDIKPEENLPFIGITKTEKTELFPNSPFSDCGLSTSPASSTIDIKPGENLPFIDPFPGMDDGITQENEVEVMQQELINNLETPGDNYSYIHVCTDFAYSPETSDLTLDSFSSFPPEKTQIPNPLFDIFELMGMNPEAMELDIKIYYTGIAVHSERVVQNSVGCRIHSGADFTQIPELQRLFGPQDALQIQFPPLDSPIMTTVHRGLLLQWENNSIVATRLCRAFVYASGGCLGADVRRLNRGQPTKVFDYETFLAGLAECRLNKAPLPLYEVFFAFGQQPSTSSTVDPTVPIMVSLTHLTAKTSISKMGSAHEVNFSAENEDDMLAFQLQRMALQSAQQMVPTAQGATLQ